MKPGRKDVLPLSLPPLGLSQVEAARYIGVSPTKFDQMVKDGRMPKPKRIDGRRVWARHQVDIAFATLPDENDRDDIWARVAV
jgi:predicted DNA-binding transcriptional regulator AlpA